MRRFFLIGFLTVLAAFVAVAAYRLSIDALALIIGLVLGMFMMIPALVVLAWTTKRTSDADANTQALSQPPQPIIIMPPQAPAWSQLPPHQQAGADQLLPNPPAPTIKQREWVMHIYGEKAEEENAGVVDKPRW
ncbi:MAG: hypothetical protein GY759_19285 [Chloroflexi bacterium]|nr:hypothetical protein [Chloroflexota bacterium]